jgi:hypothetical protein
VSPVKYEMGFYIPEDGILQYNCLMNYVTSVQGKSHVNGVHGRSNNNIYVSVASGDS